MDPHTRRVVALLREFMRPFPITFRAPPQGLEREARAFRRGGALERFSEGIEVHGSLAITEMRQDHVRKHDIFSHT